MKNIVLVLVLLIIFFLSTIACARGETLDGLWEGEGSFANFELLLRERRGVIFGILIARVKNQHNWKSFPFVEGKRDGSKILLTVITDGCDGSEGAGKVIITGFLSGGITQV